MFTILKIEKKETYLQVQQTQQETAYFLTFLTFPVIT